MEEPKKRWRQTRTFSPLRRGKVDDYTITPTKVQKITGERVLFVNGGTREIGAASGKRYANAVKRTRDQKPIVVQVCQRVDTRPAFMKDDLGEVFLINIEGDVKKLPTLFAPGDWELKLESVGFFLAKTTRSGSRRKLSKIPVGCWVRKTDRGYEICKYQIIQR